MKKFHFFMMSCLLAASVCFTGCNGDSPGENSEIPVVTDPNTPVKDPAGTITANISEKTSIQIYSNANIDCGYISWRGPDNFYVGGNSTSLVSICNVGEIASLGNITNIPHTSYTTPMNSNSEVACETGYGYVIKFEGGPLQSPVYVRLYVAETLVSTAGSVMGAKVKYQYPFEPTTLNVSKELLSFNQDQVPQTLTVTTDALEWTFSCKDLWISAVKDNQTLSVFVQANTGLVRRIGSIVIQANEKQKTIVIEQAMAAIATTSAPYAVGDLYYEKGVLGIVYEVETDGFQGMIVSPEQTLCAWSTVSENTGCSDLSYGMNNMKAIKKIPNWENRYPAFKWCNDFNTGNISGWYLPAKDELNDLYLSKAKVNTTLMYWRGEQIGSDRYWSSSESSNYSAWSQYFSTGSQDDYYLSFKISTYRVRAVRAF